MYKLYPAIQVQQDGLKSLSLKMPTVLYVNGWRFFFYSNEGHEPVHIHAQKGEKECKFWLIEAMFDIEEAYVYQMSNKDLKEVSALFSRILMT